MQLYAGADAPGARTVYEAESHDAALVLVRAFAAAGRREGVAAAARDGSVRGDLGTVRFSGRRRGRGAAVTVWRIAGGRSVRER